MTKKVNNNTAYEIFVQELHQQLLRATGLENIEVKHNVDLIGISGQSHQIDVYWEYRYAGVIHRVALECKNYSKTISLGRIRDFHSVLVDIVGLQGIMVTRVGYQSGVIKIAETYNIGLRLAREVEDKDFEGRIRGFTMNLSAISKDVVNLDIILDEQWCVDNLGKGDMAQLAEGGLSGYPGSELIVKDDDL